MNVLTIGIILQNDLDLRDRVYLFLKLIQANPICKTHPLVMTHRLDLKKINPFASESTEDRTRV